MRSQLLNAVLVASLASAAVHEIEVGGQGETFTPETIDNVKEGDFLVFTLNPNHDVVSGEFDSPCRPEDGDDVFFSGPYSGSDGGKKKFVVNVTSDDPIYWYCSVGRHCQNGMVGGANLPSSGDTIDAYKSAASNAQSSDRPDDVTGGELLEDEQIASLTGDQGNSPSPSPSPSRSGSPSSSPSPSTTQSGAPSGSSAPPPASSTTGAASTLAVGQLTGVLGAVFAVVGWFL